MYKNYAISLKVSEQKISNKAILIYNSISFLILISLLILGLNQNLKAQENTNYELISSSREVKPTKALDTNPPTVITKNIDIHLNQKGKTIVRPEDINNGSHDNVGISSMQISKSEFSCSDLGKNIVTLTVTDVNGNTSSETAIVNLISEKVAPVKSINDTVIYNNEVLSVTGPDGKDYLWSTGSTNKELYIPPNTLDLGYNIIGLKMKNNLGCTKNLAFRVYVKECPYPNETVQKIKLYPNPGSGKFNIERTNNNLMNIEIYSSDGKLYKTLQSSDKKTLIDITSANRGVFYFKVITTEMTKTFKVIKR